MIAGYKLAF